MALASAMTSNTVLTSLRLDGNPIGHDGARAMLRAQVLRRRMGDGGLELEEYERKEQAERHSRLRRSSCASPYNFPHGESTEASEQRHISMLRCSIERPANTSATIVFDPSDPNGNYELNLEDPYDAFVFSELTLQAHDNVNNRWNWSEVRGLTEYCQLCTDNMNGDQHR